MTANSNPEDLNLPRLPANQSHRYINTELGFLLGWNDVFNRYRRSSLGAFWLTLSMAVLIITLGIIFSALFDVPLAEFLPFVCLGLVFWTFISTSLNEGCVSFIQAEHLILQIKLPLFTHTLRVWWRNIVVLAHNITIFPIILLFFWTAPGPEALLAIPGFALLTVNVFWMVFVLGLLCARYRDVTLIVQNILQVLFYATPIMWLPEILKGKTIATVLSLNPVFHLIEIVRAPLLGAVPDWISYAYCLALAVVGLSIAAITHNKYRRTLPYWL